MNISTRYEQGLIPSVVDDTDQDNIYLGYFLNGDPTKSAIIRLMKCGAITRRLYAYGMFEYFFNWNDKASITDWRFRDFPEGTGMNSCPVAVTVNYGLLYNYMAAVDLRKITSNDNIIVPTRAQIISLFEYYDNAPIDGIYYTSAVELKEAGLTHWDDINIANGLSGFKLVGSGERNGIDGTFSGLRSYANYLCSDKSAGLVNGYYTDNSSGYIWPIEVVGGGETDGYAIRLMKLTTTLTNGQAGTYQGNDGKVYPTICINGVEWLAANLAETKWRDGSWIKGYDGGIYTPMSNSAWINLLESGLCAYNDDESNILAA